MSHVGGTQAHDVSKCPHVTLCARAGPEAHTRACSAVGVTTPPDGHVPARDTPAMCGPPKCRMGEPELTKVFWKRNNCLLISMYIHAKHTLLGKKFPHHDGFQSPLLV